MKNNNCIIKWNPIYLNYTYYTQDKIYHNVQVSLSYNTDGYIKEDLDLELKSMTDINLRYITQDSKLDIGAILSIISYRDCN